MPVRFEEVTGEIQQEPRGTGSGTPERAPAAPAEDLRDQLDHELRLIAERQARLCAD